MLLKKGIPCFDSLSTNGNLSIIQSDLRSPRLRNLLDYGSSDYRHDRY